MPTYNTVILDIEGTTTPITFVKDVLVSLLPTARKWTPISMRLIVRIQFPYVTSGLYKFLTDNWGSPELNQQIDLLRQQVSLFVMIIQDFRLWLADKVWLVGWTRYGSRYQASCPYSTWNKQVSCFFVYQIIINRWYTCQSTIHLLNSNADQVRAAVQQCIEWQMQEDRKIGALKSFQGYMWKEGYETGELRGQ